MVCLAGKMLLIGSSRGFHHRALLIPWMKKNSVNCCFRGRVYCSSFPVRYVPKKSGNTQKQQNNPIPMKDFKNGEMPCILEPEVCKIEVSNGGKSMQRSFGLDQQSRNRSPKQKQRTIRDLSLHVESEEEIHDSTAFEHGLMSKPEEVVREYTNAAKGFPNQDELCHQRSFVLDYQLKNHTLSRNKRTTSDHESEEEIHGSTIGDYGLMSEPEEDVHEYCINDAKAFQNQGKLRDNNAKQDVERLAVELLATRAYTAVELRKKLLGKRFTVDIVDAVVMEFQDRGLINDSLYAEMFSQSRWSSSSWGPKRIKQALFMKGVSNADAEKAIKKVFDDNGDDGDQESGESVCGFSKLSMDQLYVQASKQWLRSRDASIETRKSRVIRWLQYRGFNWGVINSIIKKLQSAHPS